MSKRLADVDFYDIEHGIDVFVERLGDSNERARLSRMLLAAVEGLRGSGAERFREAVAVCEWQGNDDTLTQLRAAFTEMVLGHSGWSAAQALQQESRQQAREHGKLGGRQPDPVKAHAEAGWLAEYEKRVRRNPALSVSSVAEQLERELAHTERARSKRTIETAIKRLLKQRK